MNTRLALVKSNFSSSQNFYFLQLFLINCLINFRAKGHGTTRQFQIIPYLRPTTLIPSAYVTRATTDTSLSFRPLL